MDWIGTPERLNDLLEVADVLLISAPLTRATYGLIGAAELGRMKEDAILVNLARGEIVQEKPLYDHLVRHPRFPTALSSSICRRDKSPSSTGSEVVPFASRQPNNQYRQNGTYSCVTHALGDHQTQPPYPASVVNFVQTRAPIIEHDHRHAKHHLGLAKTRERVLPAK